MDKNKTCTDTFSFESEPFFQQLRKTLPSERAHSQNLIECKDDMIFAWNSTESSVLALNWRTAKAKNDGNIKFQTLLPSACVNFTVEKITASHDGFFLALSGNRGVAVLELPRRWGPNGQYKEGKEKILCSSHNLDERFFNNDPLVNVMQVRWHPASPKGYTLLVLLSNNSIRVYEESVLRHVWRIGAIPFALPPTDSRLPFLNSLGDTAVDFDIAPMRVVKSNSEDTIIDAAAKNNDNRTNSSVVSKSGDGRTVEWPLIILRGNGSIYVTLIGVDTEKPRIQGPLTMYPPTQDNYGVDSCSILVLPTNPATIIIAEPTGKLFHSILLESEPDEKNTSFNEVDASIKIYPSEYVIHVLEVVELEFGLTDQKSKESLASPILLKADINNYCRYFAYHNTGLHAVSVQFIQELERYFDDEAHNDEAPLLRKPSHAEYLVCTKTFDNCKINPVFGLTMLQCPAGLVVVLGSGQVVSLHVITNPTIVRSIGKGSSDSSKSSDINTESSTLKKIFSESFETHIKNILASGVSQPILKSNDAKDVSPKEILDLLIYATKTLHEQYIKKHDKVKQEIEKRAKILQSIKQQQQEELAQLEQDKNQIRNDAERLAELYEEINDKQQELFKRTQDIIRLANLKFPDGVVAEKNFTAQIDKINGAVKNLANNIAMAKKKMEKQKVQIAGDSESNKKKLILPPKQETVIKEIITDMNGQIQSQIKELKRIKSILKIE